jgi:hypothetical protein
VNHFGRHLPSGYCLTLGVSDLTVSLPHLCNS